MTLMMISWKSYLVWWQWWDHHKVPSMYLMWLLWLCYHCHHIRYDFDDDLTITVFNDDFAVTVLDVTLMMISSLSVILDMTMMIWFYNCYYHFVIIIITSKLVILTSSVTPHTHVCLLSRLSSHGSICSAASKPDSPSLQIIIS